MRGSVGCRGAGRADDRGPGRRDLAAVGRRWPRQPSAPASRRCSGPTTTRARRRTASSGSLDAWTTLAGLAAVTERIRLGTLVSPVTFRHPSLLARSVVTVDHISGGRVELGMGTGWMELEHRAFGFPFPPYDVRIVELAEQVEIVHREWTEETFDFRGLDYELRDARGAAVPGAAPPSAADHRRDGQAAIARGRRALGRRVQQLLPAARFLHARCGRAWTTRCAQSAASRARCRCRSWRASRSPRTRRG